MFFVPALARPSEQVWQDASEPNAYIKGNRQLYGCVLVLVVVLLLMLLLLLLCALFLVNWL